MENKENINLIDKRDRLNKGIAYLKGIQAIKTQKDISDTKIISESSLTRALKPDEKYLTDNFLRKFAEKFNFNDKWFLTGEGEMLKGDTGVEKEEEKGEITGYYYPNVDAAAGLDRALMNNDIEKVPVYLPNFGKDIDFINVYGDSMYPRYNAGEIIGIKHTEFQYLNYGYPYVVVFKNGDVFIKYVRKGKDDEHVLLASENPIYEPREFHLELIKDFYSIRGVVKKEMM